MSDTDEVPGQADRPDGDVPLVYEPIVAAAEVAHRQLTPGYRAFGRPRAPVGAPVPRQLLVGSLDITDPTLADEYELNGVRYRVTSLIESDGIRGLGVRVSP